jgi:glutamate/tyrosine decarboxylase-like PLP-dependent enzyme
MGDRVFPEDGWSAAQVMRALEDAKRGDVDWRRGRAPMYVFHAGQDLYDVTRDAFMAYFTENALGTRAFPSLVRLEREVLAMANEILNGPEEVAGAFTSGGTESIFLAVKTARDWSRAHGRRRDTLVVPETAHPAFNKAAHYMDLRVMRVPVRHDLRADVGAMAAAIDERTLLITGSAPCFPFGVIDPIPELAAVASGRGVWMHVDACVGGFLAPFVRRLGHPVPPFDLSVPGVDSISADLHKLGFAAKPASTVLYRSRELSAHQGYRFDDWPRGANDLQGFTGSRPGGAVAAAWAVLHFLGARGYMDIARRIIAVRERLRAGITAIDGLRILSDPELNIFAYGTDDLDMAAMADGLADRGWLVGRNARPPAIQFMLVPLHEVMVDDYLRDLASVAAEVRGGRAGRGVAATY